MGWWPGFKQILIDFSGWTSAHGIPHIGSAESTILRIFWTIITLMSAGMFGYQMYTLIDKYLSFNKSVQTKLKFEKRVFPAVTVCHLNPVRESMLNNSDFVHLNAAFRTTRNATEGGTLDSTANADKFGFSPTASESDTQSLAQDWSEFITYRIGEAGLESMGYSYDELVMNCAYNTKPCNETDFQRMFDPKYGFCYTFNKAGTYESTRAGPLYGLRLLVRLHQPDYMPYIKAAGVRVTVHSKDAHPFGDAFGFNAAPGFATSFGVKYVKTNRLGHPHGTCIEQSSNAYYFPDSYVVEGCFRSCLQNEIVDKCQCFDPSLGLVDGKTSCSDFPSGSWTVGTEKLKCIAEVGKAFNIIEKCECPQTCEEGSYSVTVSTALWPSEVYKPPDCNNITLTKKYWKKIADCMDWYRLNTLLLEVYYERMNYQEMTEVEDYGVVNLISDTGGQIGLWLGVSFITCIEFLSLGIMLCCYCASRRKRQDASDVLQKEKEAELDADSDGDSDVQIGEDIESLDGDEKVKDAVDVAEEAKKDN